MTMTNIAHEMSTSHDDRHFDDFLGRVQARFLASTESGKRPIFTSSVDGDALFGAYLDALPQQNRQYHTCNACRTFMRRFGGLITIDERGATSSAVWHEDDAPDYYKTAIRAMLGLIRKADVGGVFYASEPVWGQPVTGPWTHFALVPPKTMLHTSRVLTAYQKAAEKREDMGAVARALGEFSIEHVRTAVNLLKSDALYRSEKVLGPAEWLLKLHESRAAANGKRARENVLWLAVAEAPAGFCHPRSSMIGTLLEDIAAGKSFADVSASFKAKMSPILYQRPQAPPSAGTIAQAEKLVVQLGITESLRRRFARVEEIDALWRPKRDEPATKDAGGVFSRLKPKGEPAPRAMALPAATMTWEKFHRTVLPDVRRIELFTPAHGNYTAILTEAVAGSPPILQWDNEGKRNPFSSYVWIGGSPAVQWRLPARAWVPVTALALSPQHWFGGSSPNHSKGLVFVLEGARETRNAGLALFPEILKGELHGVRSVIEAHSRSGKLEGMEEATACGLATGTSGWEAVRLRAVTADGTREYSLDRWD